jgi:hypothetical protein
VTVCIAALFRWNYAALGEPANHGVAALTASDRMITAADVQYEPQQQKIAFFGKSLILIAGDIGIHSQAIRETQKQVRGRDPTPHEIALIFGREIQAINRRHAENEILAPLGLNTDTFMAQQKDFSEGFVNSITGQLQNRRPVEVEALVVGTDGNEAHIYSVDSYGNDVSLDDVGFGAIGIGAWHAKSRLMQIGHVNTRILAPTLASIFAAKKNAEIAPGVGAATDIQVVLKSGITALWPGAFPELEKLYKKYSDEVSKFGEAMVSELQEFINRPREQATGDDKGTPGENAQADAGVSADAAEAPRGNEGTEGSREEGEPKIS